MKHGKLEPKPEAGKIEPEIGIGLVPGVGVGFGIGLVPGVGVGFGIGLVHEVGMGLVHEVGMGLVHEVGKGEIGVQGFPCLGGRPHGG